MQLTLTVLMNTTRRLHAFYVRVGTTIPLTGTVRANLVDFNLHMLLKSLSHHLFNLTKRG